MSEVKVTSKWKAEELVRSGDYTCQRVLETHKFYGGYRTTEYFMCTPTQKERPPYRGPTITLGK